MTHRSRAALALAACLGVLPATIALGADVTTKPSETPKPGTVTAQGTTTVTTLAVTAVPVAPAATQPAPATTQPAQAQVIAAHATATPATTTASAPKPAAPDDGNVKIADDARPLLQQIADAYSAHRALEMSGSLSLDYSIADQTRRDAATFTARCDAQGRFRSEAPSDSEVGFTGSRAYLFVPTRQEYLQKDVQKAAGGQAGDEQMHDAAPAARATTQPTRFVLDDMPKFVKDVVRAQNPSLAMALAADPRAEFLDGLKEVHTLPGGALGCTDNDGDKIEIHADPTTHLLTKVVVDQKPALEKQGQSDVKSATMVYEFAQTKALDEKNAQFAWTPPADAREATQTFADSGGQDGSALEGKKAPDFTLPALDKSQVTLSKARGSVVVLDFWATWCGPCQAELPHLQKLADAYKDKGVVVYAISVDQEQEKVAPFVAEHKLTMPVLLDNADSPVAAKYGVNGIPQTVVIGKDGVVKKVTVGFGGNLDDIKAAVDAALK